MFRFRLPLCLAYEPLYGIESVAAWGRSVDENRAEAVLRVTAENRQVRSGEVGRMEIAL